jgi:hypothetical protein
MFAGKIGFKDPTGPRTSRSNMDIDAQFNGFRQRFPQWGPSDRDNSLCQAAAHQSDGLTKQEDLHLMTGFGEGIGMQKGECCFGGVIGSPGTLDQDSAHRFLLYLCNELAA